MSAIPDVEGLTTRECEQCGLRYRKELANCPHCHSLSDDELTILKSRVRDQKARIGNIRVVVLATLVAGVLVLFLFTL